MICTMILPTKTEVKIYDLNNTTHTKTSVIIKHKKK